MSQNTMKPTRLPSRGMIILALVATLIAGGGLVWWFTSGSDSLELPSESAPAFAEVTILASDELPVTTPSCMQSFGVTFAGRMTSETVQLNGVTFNRNAERTVIDVPVELGQLDSITVDGMYVRVMVVPATYKISYFFPRDLWGEVQQVAVCFA